jgi:hypothetical protein
MGRSPFCSGNYANQFGGKAVIKREDVNIGLRALVLRCWVDQLERENVTNIIFFVD